MLKEFRIYYKIFSSRFLVRSFFVKLFHIYGAEVRQLDIADKLIARGFSVALLTNNKIRLSLTINAVPLSVVLRKATSDLLVFNQVMITREYEPLYDLIKKYDAIQEISVIVDIGANIGLTSLYLGCLFPTATIHAVEPVRSNFEILEENSSANSQRVLAHQSALLPSRGRVKISTEFRDHQEWSSRVVPSDSPTDVPALSLDDLMVENGLEQVDILKVDVEGHEAELFASDKFLFALKGVRFIALEMHEEKVDRIDIINVLQHLGFKLVYKGQTVFGVNEGCL